MGGKKNEESCRERARSNRKGERALGGDPLKPSHSHPTKPRVSPCCTCPHIIHSFVVGYENGRQSAPKKVGWGKGKGWGRSKLAKWGEVSIPPKPTWE